MRAFTSEEGWNWTARVFDGAPSPEPSRPGWEAILFEALHPIRVERLVYRPPGWVERATPDELAAALSEGTRIRARWGDDGNG
jgi:hypothetical protein